MPTTIDRELESTRGDLGMGVYELGDLRRLIATARRPTSSDMRVRERSPRGAHVGSEHVAYWLRAALNPVPHRPWQADYSFSDLISLLVVRELLDRGVKSSTVREAEDWMRKEVGVDRPFVRDDIQTDGVEVFYRDGVTPGQIEAASRRGQQAILVLIKDQLSNVSYVRGRASSWSPVEGVIVDPSIQFGSPVVAGTGTLTSAVSGVAQRLGAERAASRFDLPLERVHNAVQFERNLAGALN